MARKKSTTPNKPFDATTKSLVEVNPKDWLDFLGLPATTYELVSADLSTVTTEADRLIRVTTPVEYGVHQEFQAGAESRFPDRCLRYNVLAEEKLQIPIHTVAILLRPEADSYHNVTGLLERRDVRGQVYHWFRYQVVRLWQVPVATVLRGGLATLPLALLCDLSGTAPESIVQQMEARLVAEAPTDTARFLWTATYILMGLTYPAEFAYKLLSGVEQMKESTTYQKILEEGRQEGRTEGLQAGRAEEAQNMLLLIGERRFGKPTAAVVRRIRAIHTPDPLEAMAQRLFEVESWEELLA